MVLALARALAATSGRAVAVRAVPFVCAVGVVSAIVFGGHGVPPSTVVAAMHGSLAVRLALFVAWTLFASPAVARAFDAPGTITLRSLRPPEPALFGLLLGLVALVQLPWLALAASTGVLAGVVAALVACAASSSLPGFAGAITLVAVDPPAWVAVVPALALALLSVRHAWRRAFVQRASLRVVRRAPPAIALALTYVARMFRGGRARVQAAAIVILAGEGALALTLRNDPDARPLSRARSVRISSLVGTRLTDVA